MKDERRENNAELLKFMGKVEQHMIFSNEIQKDYVIDRKDIYGKIGDLDKRQVKSETKIGIITWVGSAFTLTGLAVIGRWIYLKISVH
jgi:hypothetical protein